MAWQRFAALNGSVEHCRRNGIYSLISNREGDGRHWRLLRDVEGGSPEDIGGRGPIDGSEATSDEAIADVEGWADAQIWEREERAR